MAIVRANSGVQACEHGRSRCGAGVWLALAIASCIVSLGLPRAGEAATLVGLGDLLGGDFLSEATGVSADGSVVVGGGSPASGNEAFRWTAADGMVGLGDLPGGFFSSYGDGVSADGSVVVGGAYSASGNEAFRWTAAGGMVGLGDLPGGSFSSLASGVSADGSVVVGQSIAASGNQAFRWTAAGGMVGLVGAYWATDVSADGAVVVGGMSPSSAFRWTAGSGVVSLGTLPGDIASFARAVSADGAVVVGESWYSNPNQGFVRQQAFRWTATGGMVGLGGLPNKPIWTPPAILFSLSPLISHRVRLQSYLRPL